MHKEIKHKFGTLTYDLTKTAEGYKGRVQNDLHKHPKFAGRVLTRYSPKAWKTERGATNWLQKQIDIQQS